MIVAWMSRLAPSSSTASSSLAACPLKAVRWRVTRPGAESAIGFLGDVSDAGPVAGTLAWSASDAIRGLAKTEGQVDLLLGVSMPLLIARFW